MKKQTSQTYRIFWQHIRRYPLLLSIIILGTIFGSAINMVPPLLYKRFFDVLAGASTPATSVMQDLIHILWQIGGVFMLSWLIWRVLLFANNVFQPSVMRDLSNTCFSYLHGHATTFFQNNFVGSLVRRVNKFAASFERMADLLLFNFLRIVVDIVITTVVLSFYNWIFAAVLLVWIVILVSMNYAFSMYKLKYDIERSEQESRTTGLLADTITNQENIKLFNGFSREQKTFGSTTEELRRLMIRAWNLGEYFESVQILLMFVLELGMMYIATRLWQKGEFSLGDFVLLQAYVINMFHRLWDVGRYIRNYYELLADSAEMTEILNTPHAIVDHRNAVPLKVESGTIQFDEVTFTYNETRVILQNFSLTIPGGERVALVGHSGAGKSTIVKLLLRAYDVTSGQLCIDDQPIDRATRDSLADAISYVPQDPILFHRSLMENIRYGSPDATDEEVMQAAKLAHAHEFILACQDGYETLVGERGIKLSGGERQRIAIARAILKNAPILILDEATSSLDSESETLIQDALSILMKGKTVLVIAHRLSTIMAMDRILVIEEGAIVEEGSHKALLKKKKGFYTKLWNLQAGTFIGE